MVFHSLGTTLYWNFIRYPMNGLIFVQFETLTLNKDFRRLYGRGRSFVHPALVTYVSKNRLGYPRIGITTGKKLGKAVERNRARRLIRAAWYDCLPDVNIGVDIVFVARTRTLSSKSTDIAKLMRKHLIAAGIINMGNNNETSVN